MWAQVVSAQNKDTARRLRNPQVPQLPGITLLLVFNDDDGLAKKILRQGVTIHHDNYFNVACSCFQKKLNRFLQALMPLVRRYDYRRSHYQPCAFAISFCILALTSKSGW